MRAAPVNLIGGFYADDSLPWSAQDTVNLLPYAAETVGTRTQFILRDAPGLRPLVRVETPDIVGDEVTTPGLGGPIRGMRVVEGKLLVVSGNTLFQVTNSLVSIPRGTIPGTGPVSMTHNQRGTTNQVLIVNGAAGYVYDTSALTLTKITDDGYPGAFVADFVDGYLAQIEPRRRYWFHSALRDALNYNTLDRYEAEGQPDALVSLIVDHREVWVFGERSIEPFVNTGAATNTFQRASNTVIEQGCSARFSPAKLDNSVLWLDDLGIVRRAQGYTPVRVSTGPIERAIADLDWSRAFGFTWTDRGHAVYYLTFPDGQTWGYDLVTGVWHRRQSYGIDRWRVSSMVYWNGQWIAGDFQRGLLYVVDWDYPLEGDQPLVRERITGVTHGDQARVIIPYAELIVDTGGRTVEAVEAPEQPTGPTISGNAPNGEVGEAYSYAYTVGGGTAPLVVRVFSGSLPPGLTLSTAGVLSGTPTLGGSYSWVVRVTDKNGLYAEVEDSVSTDAPFFLFHYGGADGSTDFVDVGNLGITWTRTADSSGGTLPTISTDEAKFGTSSGFFVQGSTNVSGFLQGTGVPGLSDGSFTYETFLWIEPGATVNNGIPIGFSDGSSVTGVFINASGTGQPTRQVSQVVGESVGSFTSVAVSTWVHAVIQRRPGNLWDLFIDGVLIQTRTIDYEFVAGAAIPRIGYRFGGHLAETRFTRDAALYDPAGFTPPAAPFEPPQEP